MKKELELKEKRLKHNKTRNKREEKERNNFK